MLQDAYSRPGLDTEGKARALSVYTLSLADALSAADKIPSDKSASSAALDVLDHVFGCIHSPETDPDRSWLVEIREGKRRKHRASWAGYQPHSVVRERVAQMRAPIKAIGESAQSAPLETPGLSHLTTPTPTERYHARTRAARMERIADLHKSADARKILKAIGRSEPMQLKDISPLVPKMKRLALRALMLHLREGGWVESVGIGGGAAWTGTDKLKSLKI
ncbi:MAG: hypothetical protein ACK4PN_12435 [Allorhizobium sp.]